MGRRKNLGREWLLAVAEQAEEQSLGHQREAEAWRAVEFMSRSRTAEMVDDETTAAELETQAVAALHRVMSAPEYQALPAFGGREATKIFQLLEELGLL